MDNKNNELTDELIKKLQSMFVDDFDKVNCAKNDINVYLESLGVVTKYTYNEFCKDFMDISANIIQTFNLDDIYSQGSDYIIKEILYNIVIFKIKNSGESEMKIAQQILSHELSTKAITRF